MAARGWYNCRSVPKVQEPLLELRFSDLVTFLAVRRHGSLAAVARELGVTTSQVSKAITRLERQLNVKLLARSSKGAVLSDSAVRMVPQLEAVTAQLRNLRRGGETAVGQEVTLAAPSHILQTFAPTLAIALGSLRLRCLQMAMAAITGQATQNIFDLALAPADGRYPSSWNVEKLGSIRNGLFTTPAVAATLRPFPVAPERLKHVPFVSPVHHVNSQLVPVEDGCPLPYTERRLGHETQTVALGLEVAAATGQLVFGPRAVARRQLDIGALVEVPVQGWQVEDPLYLVANVDRVVAPVRKLVAETVVRTLEKLNTY